MRKTVFTYFSVSLLISIFGLFGSVFIARILGPESRGDVAAAILWPTLLLYLGSIGTFQSFIYFYSKERDYSIMWGNCICATIMNSILSILCGVVLIKYVLVGVSPNVKYYSFVLLMTIPFSVLSQFISSILQAKQKFKQANILRSIFPILYLLSIIVLYFTNKLSFESIIKIQSLLNIVLAFISLVFYNVLIGNIRKFRLHRRSFTLIYYYGAKVWVGDLSQGLNIRLDQIIITNLFNSTQLGYYVVAQSIANFTSLLANSYRSILMPMIASNIHKNGLYVILKSNLRSFHIINTTVILVSLLLTPLLIIIIYGEEFKGSVYLALILLVGYAFMNMKTIYATILQGFGKPFQASLSEIFGFVFLGVLAYPFSSHFGMKGIVIVITLSYVIQFLVVYYFYHKQKLNQC